MAITNTTVSDRAGFAPYIQKDMSRAWAEAFRENGMISPQLVLRTATDLNWVHNMNKKLPAYADTKRHTNSLMNCALPGQIVPNVLNWQVDESVDSEASTASFEIVNAMPVSTISTTLTAKLSDDYYSDTILANYVGNSTGVTEKKTGNNNVEALSDVSGVKFREKNVRFRQFDYQVINLTSLQSFPNPSIPDDVDNDVTDEALYPKATNGVGSYFILIDEEVIRVSKWDYANNKLYVIPGGRACNGVLQDHAVGAKVTLLGFQPQTGELAGYGMFAVDDYKPYMSMFRTGACFVSYEGYGQIKGPMSHSVSDGRNYAFTGYWFVKSVEDSLGDDGVPKLKVSLAGPGDLTTRQKITIDVVQRMKTTYGSWLDGVWAEGGANRDIPGDWVDYHSWDPTLPLSYPLKIKTEVAQHREFFDHMRDTAQGAKCLLCRAERKKWLAKPQNAALPAATKALLLQRAVGKHVYRQSIRVLNPIQTYIRLMMTMCVAAWDHPPQGLDLAQKFTKIPNKLFRNLRAVNTGLIYNGQLDFELESGKKNFDWSEPTYDDNRIISSRKSLSCPFEASYDNAPFSQPVRDLADMNDAVFWINREGYPVFVPRSFRLRPYSATGSNAEKSEWTLSYGSSISNYSHTIDSESVITQVSVHGQTAFDSASFDATAAGTGFNKNGDKVVYGPVSGNRDGLMVTGGVQQLDTISMDNMLLGLEWNVNPESTGIIRKTAEGTTEVQAIPPMYWGIPELYVDGPKNEKSIKAVQTICNFFFERAYVTPVTIPASGNTAEKTWYGVNADGKYGNVTAAFVTKVQAAVGAAQTGRYDFTTATKINQWYKTNQHYIKFDIWWYVQNGREWDEYVAALVGLPVTMKKNKRYKSTIKGKTSSKTKELPKYLIDDKALLKEVNKWLTKFAQDAVNMGNRKIDDANNRASQRILSTNIADPRIQPGDIIWASIPGHLEDTNKEGGRQAPFSNGIYVQSTGRQMDLQSGTYTATYSGYRYTGNLGKGARRGIGKGYDFITQNIAMGKD